MRHLPNKIGAALVLSGIVSAYAVCYLPGSAQYCAQVGWAMVTTAGGGCNQTAWMSAMDWGTYEPATTTSGPGYTRSWTTEQCDLTSRQVWGEYTNPCTMQTEFAQWPVSYWKVTTNTGC